jgi:hypothetical protein
VGPWFSPKCDNNFSPPRCSDYYHMLEQTPGYPHGDGDCAAPGCDCGTMPCAFYLWNRSIARLGASLPGLLFFAQPVVGGLLGATVLGEVLSTSFFIGGALVASAVVLSARET